MSTDLPTLFETYLRARDAARALVLATIVDTEGSTYRKPGARMLLTPGGGQTGVLGGGCFEADLAVHADAALAAEEARLVEYDMRGDDDLIWGLGLGCNGLVRILLQPLTGASGYEPFASLMAAAERPDEAVLATVLGGPAVTGASLAIDDDGARDLGLAPAEWPEVVTAAAARMDGRSGTAKLATSGGELEVFFDRLRPLTHLLMLGAGPDAEPVARLARQLCWRVTILDHREAWVRPDRFPAGCDVRGVAPETLADSVDLASVSAAVIMSHSFTADEAYLRSIAAAPPPYVGLLGPAARRDALLATLESKQRARLADRTRGPVGLNLGGRSPQAIALSLIAEVQAVLSGRDGQPLDDRLRAVAGRRAAG